MNAFLRLSPVNYQHPYKDMLKDINAEMDLFFSIRKKAANYILINTNDFEELVLALQKAKLFPFGKVADKLQYRGARVIRTTDIAQGDFDVLGN